MMDPKGSANPEVREPFQRAEGKTFVESFSVFSEAMRSELTAKEELHKDSDSRRPVEGSDWRARRLLGLVSRRNLRKKELGGPPF